MKHRTLARAHTNTHTALRSMEERWTFINTVFPTTLTHTLSLCHIRRNDETKAQRDKNAFFFNKRRTLTTNKTNVKL